LRLLNIQSTNITNTSLAHVGRLASSLGWLYVQNCNQIDENGFSALMHERRVSRRKQSMMVMAGGLSGQPVAHAILVWLAVHYVSYFIGVSAHGECAR
jgi:hypothetical protein